MKKVILFSFIIIGSLKNFACPICGCGNGNLYMGLMPSFKNTFLGVRYHYAEYHTQITNDPTQYSNNYYHTTEFWGGINISQKIKVMAFVPYYFNKQVDDDKTSFTNGLGDVSIMGQYQLLHKFGITKSQKIIEQQLWMGAGIKLATGSFNVDVTDPSTTVADINAQSGTGSTDFLMSATYSIKQKNNGLNISAAYKINSVNYADYKYGNKLSINAIAYHQINNKKTAIVPNAGLGYETNEANQLSGAKIQFTKSHLLTALAGVEFGFKNITIGMNLQLPLQQNFAEGQTRNTLKSMLHATFTL